MVIDRSGDWWRGSDAADLDVYLADYSADSYVVSTVVHAECASCTSRTFAVLLDDEEGVALRCCRYCGDAQWMLDSGQDVEAAETVTAACPCGGEDFEVAVGFAFTEAGHVRWVYVALRCVADGTLGVYADWKVDHAPTGHLLAQV